jgi:hypothetical protein
LGFGVTSNFLRATKQQVSTLDHASMSDALVKIAFSPNFHNVTPVAPVGSRYCAREKNQHLTTFFYPLACHQPYPACALRRNVFREHAPSEDIRLLQQPSVITGMFTPTVFAT